MKVPDHQRIRMRAVSCAQNVMSAADIGDPIAHRFVDCFFQSSLTRLYGHDFRAEHFHAKDIEALAFAIDRAHVNDAFEAKHRRDRRSGNAVLAGTGFGNYAGLAHAFGEENLANAIIDFVGAGVKEVLSFEIDFCAAKFLSEPLGKIEWCWTPAEFFQVILKFPLKLG